MATWARVAVLCNEADLHRRDGDWAWRGDPVDIAFLAAAHKLGCNRAAEREVPLDRIVNTMSADDLLSWASS